MKSVFSLVDPILADASPRNRASPTDTVSRWRSGAFPLTPALSRRERENRSTALEQAGADESSHSMERNSRNHSPTV